MARLPRRLPACRPRPPAFPRSCLDLLTLWRCPASRPRRPKWHLTVSLTVPVALTVPEERPLSDFPEGILDALAITTCQPVMVDDSTLIMPFLVCNKGISQVVDDGLLLRLLASWSRPQRGVTNSKRPRHGEIVRVLCAERSNQREVRRPWSDPCEGPEQSWKIEALRALPLRHRARTPNEEDLDDFAVRHRNLDLDFGRSRSPVANCLEVGVA